MTGVNVSATQAHLKSCTRCILNNNNNYDNLYGAVTRPYRYKGALQAYLQATYDM